MNDDWRARVVTVAREQPQGGIIVAVVRRNGGGGGGGDKNPSDGM